MLNDLVNTFFGSLPPEFEFLKIFGYMFVIYCLAVIFASIVGVIKDFLKRW